MEDKQHRVGFFIRCLDHVLRRDLETAVRGEGIDEITLMHGWIIRYLYENRGKDIFQKDIEKQFSIGRSSVTGIIQLMEKKGYIMRESVEHDARLKKVTLTEKGAASHQKIEELITNQDEQMTRGISREDLEVFLKVAEQIRSNVEGTKRQAASEDANTDKNGQRGE